MHTFFAEGNPDHFVWANVLTNNHTNNNPLAND